MRKWAIAAAAGLLVGAPSTALSQGDAGPGASRAMLTCEHAEGPGRVRCEIEARVEPTEKIAWGDAVLTKVPPFAAPLRGRIGPDDTTSRADDEWRWAFALVAKERGTGDVAARVRLVVCRGNVCEPREMEAVGRMVVGGE